MILPPFLAASEGLDLPQIIFVVVFILIGFLQWIFKLWKEKQEQAERARKPPPSAEEMERRRRAWQQQTAEVDEPARPVPPPVPAAPAPPPQSGGLGDLIETFRKAMEEQQAKSQPPVAQAPPLPLPAAPPRSVRPPVVTAPSLPAPDSAYELHAKPETALSIKSATPGSAYKARVEKGHPLTEYLRSTGGYRKAFILKEILDAPKALQRSPWPVD